MKLKIAFFFSVAALVMFFYACKKTNQSPENVELTDIPSLPASVYDYTVTTNDHKATLGRVLFYDRNLSVNNSVSCGSCHQQNRAFCDNHAVSTGVEGRQTPRNTPSIFGRNGRLFWDGRATTLTEMVLMPVQNHVEMRFNDLDALANKLSSVSFYPDLFNKAFGSKEITKEKIREALADFVMNFNFSNNKFFKVKLNKENYTPSEQLGHEVFFGKGLCSQCHKIDNGGNSGYGSTGEFNIGLNEVYTDKGVGSFVNMPSRDGNFMTPILLNVEFTAPYMHDGRFKTLEEVVEHYNSGIKSSKNLSPLLRDFSVINGLSEEQILQKYDLNGDGDIEDDEMLAFPPVKLNLSAAEKKGLVDFLKTLSDPNILSDDRFSNPFEKK